MEVGEMNPLRRVFGIVVTNVGRIAFRVLLLLTGQKWFGPGLNSKAQQIHIECYFFHPAALLKKFDENRRKEICW
jgi:hypothetical protein